MPSSTSKSAKKLVGKYASKYVGEILERLMTAQVKVTKKNPKTVGKWLSKMKLSILRKVSIASKELFIQPGYSATELIKEVTGLKETINRQSLTIRKQASDLISRKDLTAEKSINSEHSQYSVGSFKSQVSRIENSCTQAVHELDAVVKDLPGRIHSFEESLSTTESDWQTLSKTATAIAAKKGRKSDTHNKEKGNSVVHGPKGALNTILKTT